MCRDQNHVIHVKRGKVQDAGSRTAGSRGVERKGDIPTLPEQQPDGVNKCPEIVVTVNFGAGVQANISKYLSDSFISTSTATVISYDTNKHTLTSSKLRRRTTE